MKTCHVTVSIQLRCLPVPHCCRVKAIIVTYSECVFVKMLVFERKTVRGIFGPTKENQICRVKNNEELDKLIKHENTVNYIKAQRLIWFGHIQRMPEARATKKIFK